MKTKKNLIALALAGGDLPTEFRLFKHGVNATAHGDFLFDDAAAELVMSAFNERGVDLAIDLEHQMVHDATTDPHARDARGWCQLALRSDGLYAVNVRWTPDGAERLRSRTQRYVSPAFMTDGENRVTRIVNVAITSVPATYGTPALIAASDRGASTPLDRARAKARALSARASVSRPTRTLAEARAKVQALAARAALVPRMPDFVDSLDRIRRNHLRSLGQDIPQPGGPIDLARKAASATDESQRQSAIDLVKVCF